MNSDNHIEETIIEQEKEKQHIAECVGTLSYGHFQEYKYNAVQGMLRFGGSFIVALGEALARADDINAVKLMKVWQSDISEHEMLYRIWRAKEKAYKENEVNGCILKT